MMKLKLNFILLLVGIVTAAPSNTGKEINKQDRQKTEDRYKQSKFVITKEFYNTSFIKYKSDHEIVNIILPANLLNIKTHFSTSDKEDSDKTLFFVEADMDADEKITYKGLYVFNGHTATKVLENGRDAAANMIDGYKVFFGAQDGIYLYKPDTKEAVKYGTITDSIIGIARPNISDAIYILTEDHEVYNVTQSGNIKTKVKEIDNAQQIVLDYANNLYFYSEDKRPYVLTADGVKKIEGLPAKPTEVTLIRASYPLGGIPLIIDNISFYVHANGTSVYTGYEIEPKAKPTAFSLEGLYIHYYAYKKKIYEFNYLEKFLQDILNKSN